MLCQNYILSHALEIKTTLKFNSKTYFYHAVPVLHYIITNIIMILVNLYLFSTHYSREPATRNQLDIAAGESNNSKPSTSCDLSVINNTMSRSRDKRTNELEQKQNNITNAQVQEERQNSPMDVAAANPPNVQEPGLVEKLMQQLSDLKEMVRV
jgi:hypothetical protein